VATDIENLSVLPAGPIPPNPAELLQSEKFAALLQELRERYDRIVMDSPPVAPLTDAAVLTTQADGTVLVVRAFKRLRTRLRRVPTWVKAIHGGWRGAVGRRNTSSGHAPSTAGPHVGNPVMPTMWIVSSGQPRGAIRQLGLSLGLSPAPAIACGVYILQGSAVSRLGQDSSLFVPNDLRDAAYLAVLVMGGW